MTNAEKISAMHDDDGGRELVIMGDGPWFGVTVEWRDGYRTGDTVAYRLRDGSSIIQSGDAWDLGCCAGFCWASTGCDCGAAR